MAVSLLNLLPSGGTANRGPESSQLVGRADASQPQHPGSGSQVSKISKLMSFPGSAPGSVCIQEGCASTIGQTKPTRRQLLPGSLSLGSRLPTRNTWLGQPSASPPCFSCVEQRNQLYFQVVKVACFQKVEAIFPVY